MGAAEVSIGVRDAESSPHERVCSSPSAMATSEPEAAAKSRGRGTSGESGSPEKRRLHRGPIRTALSRSQLSSQMVMFTILKPFTVHATEECKHLQVRKMSTPVVRWLPVQ